MYDRYKGLGTYGTVGLEIVLSILFWSWLGHWADGKVGARGWCTLVGFGFGLAASARAIIRTARELRRETERQDRRHGNDDRDDRSE